MIPVIDLRQFCCFTLPLYHMLEADIVVLLDYSYLLPLVTSYPAAYILHQVLAAKLFLLSEFGRFYSIVYEFLWTVKQNGSSFIQTFVLFKKAWILYKFWNFWKLRLKRSSYQYYNQPPGGTETGPASLLFLFMLYSVGTRGSLTFINVLMNCLNLIHSLTTDMKSCAETETRY